MGKQFTDVFHGNVNTATMKTKKLHGKRYLVGPVVMARQIVMNQKFYPAKELKASTPHWNGRPAVENHPKDADGQYISANDPSVIEKDGMGLIFNSTYDTETTRLRAECWLELDLLKKHPKVNDVIKEGGMLEVSTGLFLDFEEQAGNYEGRDYVGVAHNYKPDHLAILTEGVGAMSIADGAGFPRVNTQMECNELSGGDKMTLLGKAVRKNFIAADGGSFAYLVDVYDAHLIFERWVDSTEGYCLFDVPYTISADEQTVTFDKEKMKRVVRQVSYVDKIDSNVTKSQSHDGATPKTNEGERTMNRQEQISKWLADKKIDANQAEMLKGLSDVQFTGFASLVDAANQKPAVPGKPASADEGDGEGDGDEGDGEGDDGDGDGDGDGEEPEGNKAKTPKQKKVVDANSDDDFSEWSRLQYAKRRQTLTAKIKANKANPYSDEELGAMSINSLEKTAALASTTTDRALQPTGAGKGAAKKPTGNSDEGEETFKPLINPNQRRQEQKSKK